jgi:hypothetical protein
VNDDDFKWNDLEEECIITPTVMAIAVYESQRSDIIVIRQEGEQGDDDHMIFVPVISLPRIIASLTELAERKGQLLKAPPVTPATTEPGPLKNDCPKCGTLREVFNVRYVMLAEDYPTGGMRVREEWLEVHCICGFGWKEFTQEDSASTKGVTH